MPNQVENLLEDLRQIVGSTYFSDLRHDMTQMDTLTKEKIYSIPDHAYSLDTWCRVADYLLGLPCDPLAIPAIKEQIVALSIHVP